MLFHCLLKIPGLVLADPGKGRQTQGRVGEGRTGRGSGRRLHSGPGNAPGCSPWTAYSSKNPGQPEGHEQNQHTATEHWDNRRGHSRPPWTHQSHQGSLAKPHRHTDKQHQDATSGNNRVKPEAAATAQGTRACPRPISYAGARVAREHRRGPPGTAAGIVYFPHRTVKVNTVISRASLGGEQPVIPGWAVCELGRRPPLGCMGLAHDPERKGRTYSLLPSVTPQPSAFLIYPKEKARDEKREAGRGA